MRILHTADIHLRSVDDNRWHALETIIGVANSEDVDILIISGDLFDSGTDAESLRPNIRGLFSGTKFETLILPGNHDVDSYREGLYFGDNVAILLNTKPLEEYKNLRIVGIPFKKMGSVELLDLIRSLREVLDREKKNILLFHGELLDTFFSREDYGDEGKERYMPLKLSYLDDLNIDYVLAGHFHTNFTVKSLDNGGYFVYPGSPVSITKKELGIRKVNLFNLGEAPEEYELNTYHFDRIKITLDPTKEEHPLDTVKKGLSNISTLAEVILTIDGAINGMKFDLTEDTFKQLIREIADNLIIAEENFSFRDIQHIIENDLFKAFEKRLISYPQERRKELRDIAIRAMLME